MEGLKRGSWLYRSLNVLLVILLVFSLIPHAAIAAPTRVAPQDVIQQELPKIPLSLQEVMASFDLQPQQATTAFVLTMALNGNGTTNPAPGTSAWNAGTAVPIQAITSQGHVFASWTWTGSGNPVANPASASTTVTMDASRTITANFQPQQQQPQTFILTMTSSSEGATVPSPGASSWNVGASVSIQATASQGYTFASWAWTGVGNPVANSTSASTTITMDANRIVTPNFLPQPQPPQQATTTYVLTMAVNGQGTTNPPTGTSTYAANTVVPIQAIASQGYVFASWTWTGGGSPAANPAIASTTVTMDSSRVITANFQSLPPQQATGTFVLTMSVNGSGMTNPAPGTSTHKAGDVMPIFALASPGYIFASWAWTGGGNPLAHATAPFTRLTIDADRTVTANFLPYPPRFTLQVNADQDAEGRIPGDRVVVRIPKGSVTAPATVDFKEKIPQTSTGMRMVRQFTLDASLVGSGARVTQFAKDIEISVKYEPWELAGLNTESLRLYYFNEPTKQWLPVSSTYNRSTKVLSATVNHLTEFGEQADPLVSGPGRIMAAQVNMQSGAAVFSYPLELPPGPGGFQPKLELAYNSGSVDEMKNKRSVASWVGAGWTLHFGRVSYEADTNKYFLDFNGGSYELISPDGTDYRTVPDTYFKVTRATNTWEIRDREGVYFKFGGNTDSVQYYYDADKSSTVSYRWDLNLTRDTNGNQATATYVRDIKGTSPQDWVRSAYPEYIRYGSAEIHFTSSWYENDATDGYLRRDNPKTYGGNTAPKIMENRQLDSVEIKMSGTLIRKYNFAYNTTDRVYSSDYGGTYYSGKHSLASITQIGADGTSQLPAMNFTYQDIPIYRHTSDGEYVGNPGNPVTLTWQHLTAVNSGYGATVSFSYTQKPDATATGIWTREVVTNKTINSGIGATESYTYTYTGNPVYVGTGWDQKYRGFADVRETDATGNYVRHFYYTAGVLDGKDVERLSGKEYKTQWYSSADALLKEKAYDWNWVSTSSDQGVVWMMAKWGAYGSGDGQFNYPSSLAVASQGYVYVADEYNQRIQKFSSSGTFLTKWGTSGSGDGQFNYPRGIAVASQGYIYVADSGNNRIQKFDSSGNFISKWGTYGSGDGQLINPYGVVVDSQGYVYVVDSGNQRIQKFSSNGSFILKWGTYGSGDGQFYNPNGITVDSSGYVYVNDVNNQRIQKFSSSGTFVTKWGTYGSGDGQFNYPYRVAVDIRGRVYMVDTFNNRIQEFDSSGNFFSKWGTFGSGDGQFKYPLSVAVDSQSNLYVSDDINNRVQKFLLAPYFQQLNQVDNKVGTKTSRIRYLYDDYGNVKTEYLDGDISTSDDDATVHRIYYPNTSAWVLSKPARERVYATIAATDDGGSNLKKETLYYYDNNSSPYTPPATTARLTQLGMREDADSWVTSSFTFDSYGNRLTVTDPNGNTTTTAYDAAHHTYPIGKTFPVTGSKFSLKLDGSNDYVDAGNAASLNITGDLTIEVWFKANSTGKFHTLISKGADLAYNFRVRDTNVVQFYVEQSTGVLKEVATTDTISAGVWYHFVGVAKSGETLKLYINGVLNKTGEVHTDTKTAAANLRIGSRTDGWAIGFADGLIDDVRIYSRALSAAEVGDLYNGLEPSTVGLKARYRMEEGTGGTTADDSGSNNTGTLYNRASWETGRPLELMENYTWSTGTYNMLSKTDVNGQVTSYEYDTFKRLTKVIKPGDSSTGPSLNYTYASWGYINQQHVMTETMVATGDYLWQKEYFDGLGRVVQAQAQGETGRTIIAMTKAFSNRGLVDRQYISQDLASSQVNGYYIPTSSWKYNTYAYDGLARVTNQTSPDNTTVSHDFSNPWQDIVTNERGYKKGYLFDAFDRLNRVQEYDRTPVPPWFVSKWGSYGTATGAFTWPTGIASDSSGNIYVTDEHRVQKFDSAGNYVLHWGSQGSNNGQFSYPFGVATDKDGYVFVADSGNNRIQKFTSAGAHVTSWGSYGTATGYFNQPWDVAVDEATNSVYVVDRSNHRIQVFDKGGAFKWATGAYGSSDGQFNTPQGVAVDSSGNVYVTDMNNQRVQKFDSSGNFIRKWGVYGTGDGQFNYPWGITVDSRNDVYVADEWSHRIQKFDSNGAFIYATGSYHTSENGKFNRPSDMMVHNNGFLYVVDRANYRIQKLASASYTYEVYSTTTYKYNVLGNLTEVKDNSNNLTTIAYNWLSRKTGMTDPDMGTWSYSYASNGNLLSQTDAKGQTINFSYDALNRLIGKTYSTGMATVTYAYDSSTAGNYGKGRRTGMSDGSGSMSNKYDSWGRVIEEKRTVDSVPYTTTITYDAASRITSITYPTGETATQGYNGRGLPYRLTSSVNGTIVSGMQYNSLGLPTQIDLGNNTRTTWGYWDMEGSYDNPGNYFGRLWRIKTVKDPSGTPATLQEVRHTWDPAGNLVIRQNLKDNEVESFSYDHLDRLTSATGPYTESYAYNQIGNMTFKNGVSYTYPSAGSLRPHAVTQVGTTTYTYDANGNMTSRGTATLTWDAENRLTGVVGSASYVYDGDGFRVKKTEGSETILYINNYFEENLTTATVTLYYYLGSKMVAYKQGASLAYVYADHLTGTSITTDASGNVLGTVKYKPFGEIRSISGLLPAQKFTGQRLDDVGLYYYGARYYDPLIGRFTAPDPLVTSPSNPQNLNRYSYVLNNPLKYVDPTGKEYRFPEEELWDKGLISYEEYLAAYNAWLKWWYAQNGGGGGSGGGTGGSGGSGGGGGGSTGGSTGGGGESGGGGGGGPTNSPEPPTPPADTKDLPSTAPPEPSWYEKLKKYAPGLEILEEVFLESVSSPDELAFQFALGIPPGPGKITGFRIEGARRALFRDGVGVSDDAMFDAVKNRVSPVEYRPDKYGGTWKYIGENATVVLNKVGEVVTTWARNATGWRWR